MTMGTFKSGFTVTLGRGKCLGEVKKVVDFRHLPVNPVEGAFSLSHPVHVASQ